MPTLNWIGKEAVVEHHKEVPFHLLRCNPDLSVGEPESGNLLIQGDNLLALKALLPYYAGKVKLIYIDPPYNFGEESWIYYDNVDSPIIREWLGKVVGREAEDLSRHDKWLCMMYPRLVLLHQLLQDDGLLWVSIDDNEVHRARLILDEIFGIQNFIASVIWQKRTSPEARLPLGAAHDYILVYGKDKEKAKKTINRVPLSAKRLKDYKNPDNDSRGTWASRDMTGQTGHAADTQFYELSTPTGKKYSPPNGRCWTVSEDTFKSLAKDNRIWFGTKGNSRPRIKIFLSESEGATAWTWWSNTEVGHNQEATKELKQLFGTPPFETPKPMRLIDRIIRLSSNPDDLVLDSFGGSGTTGHAVMQANQEDGGKRRFILVEMESEIAQKITAQRLQKAIEGYTWEGQRGKVNEVEGLGSGFRFCTLDDPLFDAAGQIRANVSFTELARHVFFTETGEPLPAPAPESKDLTGFQNLSGLDSPLLGASHGQAVYLLFNGILGDKSETGGNILTRQVLASLPKHEGPKVIYGEGCLLSPSTLQEMGITFRQLPYEIKIN